jgi:hypothetical protein
MRGWRARGASLRFDFLCSGSRKGVAHFKGGFGSSRSPYNVYWSPAMTPDETRPDTGPGAALGRIQELRRHEAKEHR